MQLDTLQPPDTNIWHTAICKLQPHECTMAGDEEGYINYVDAFRYNKGMLSGLGATWISTLQPTGSYMVAF